MIKVGDIILVKKSWTLCGIMEGNEYYVTHVHNPNYISVSNGSFFSSLDKTTGDEWDVVGEIANA